MESSMSMRSSSIRLTVQIIGLLALGAASSSSISQTSEPIGYVLKVEGNWTVGGSRPLRLGQALHKEDLVAGLVGAGPNDRLTLVAGGVPHSCAGRCEKNLAAAPVDSRPRALADSLLKSAMKIFQDKPDFPSTVTIRGRINDGVAATDNERLDLSSVLKECRSDRIDLRFQSIAESPVRTIEPVAVPCDNGRPSTLLARGVGPGLYQLDLLQKSSDGYVARGVSAWVLVSPKTRHAQDASAFAELVTLTKEWGSQVDPETVVAVQRAYLESLAGQVRARP